MPIHRNDGENESNGVPYADPTILSIEKETAMPSRAEAVGLAGPIAVTGRRLDPKCEPILVPCPGYFAYPF